MRSEDFISVLGCQDGDSNDLFWVTHTPAHYYIIQYLLTIYTAASYLQVYLDI